MSHDSSSSCRPQPWQLRIRTAPALPGPGACWLDHLPEALLALDARQPDAAPTVRIQGELLDVDELAKLLGPSLVTRHAGRVQPTAGARDWAEAPDGESLILLLHRHIRLIGEVLLLLADQSLSHEELRRRANQQYGMNWQKLDQLRRRTWWLRCSDMVEIYDGLVHITASGRKLIEWLPLGVPDSVDVTEITPAPAPPLIEDALNELREKGHASRRMASSLFFPKPDGVSLIDTLQHIARSATPEIEEDRLNQFIQERFGLAPASARQVRQSSKMIGLIEKIGARRWSATPLAQAFLASGQASDLIRVAHVNLWFIGEILQLLAAQSTMSAADMALQTGGNRPGPLPQSAIRVRLGLLRECGLVAKLSAQDYRLTPSGRGLAHELPVEAPIAVSPRSSGSEPVGELAATSTETNGTQISTELLSAARDSRNSARLEHAICDALSFLGLDARILSGPSQTDVVAVLPLYPDSLTLAVDAKTSAVGPVMEDRVGFQAFADHRKKCGASATIVVGPAFHPRVIAGAQNDGQVAIVLTETLADTVLLHEKYPFCPRELKALFSPAVSVDARMQTLLQSHKKHVFLVALLEGIVTKLEAEMRMSTPLYEGRWLDVQALRRDFQQLNASEEDILKALDLLSSPFISAVERSPQQKGLFRLTAPPSVIAARLRSLTRNQLATTVA